MLIFVTTQYDKYNVIVTPTCQYKFIISRAETNTSFIGIFAWLHNYSNTKRVFGCTVNDFAVNDY